MTSRVSATGTIHVTLPCAAVFEAFLSFDRGAADPELPMIDVRVLWGAEDGPGRQKIIRHAMGVYDLEVLERIVVLDRPLRFVAEQTPLRMLPYDPAERLSPVGEEPGHPDRAFRLRFGADPAPTRFEVDCGPHAGGTDLSLTISIPSAGMGWLARRRWPRKMAAAIDRRLLDFAAGIPAAR